MTFAKTTIKFIESEIHELNNQIQVEKLAGNIVKEALLNGEKTGMQVILDYIKSYD